MIEETGAAEAAAEPVDVSEEQSLDDALGETFDRLNAEPVERDERGRFVSKDKPEEADEAEEPQAEEVEASEETEEAEEDTEQEDEPEEDGDIDPPPAHAPQAVKDAWAKLPAEARKSFSEWSRDVDRKFSEQGRQIQATRPLYEKLTGAVQQFPEFANLTPEELADGALNLAAVQARLGSDPVNTIIDVARQYGVAEHLKAALSGEQPTDQQNHIASLHSELQQLRQMVAQGSDPRLIEQRISETLESRETASVVQNFAANAPHWADAEPFLPQFIQVVRAQQPGLPQGETLKAAYDMAMHAIPELRAKAGATEKAAPKPDPERARKAKKATSTNLKSTSTGKDRVPTEEELLSQTYDRLMAD